MIFHNAKFDNVSFSSDDLYFFAFGYEHRSYYLYDKIRSSCPSINPIVFVLNDYEKYPHTLNKVKEIKGRNHSIYFHSYSEWNEVHKRILSIVNNQITDRESITIHVDYSSMPRSWYCRLPSLFESIMRETDAVYFWYSEGEYPPSYEEYPSAGIDTFSLFSGKPSLQIENNRIHVLGVGFDTIRSQAILSITDPNYLVVCYAYNPNRHGFSESVKDVNEPIFSRAAMTISLHINDFEFMVSKLCEIANELLPAGDIILIPDGPKPLIFAFSLVPDILKKHGITCLHISRNSDLFEPVDVIPTHNVFGFSINK